MNHILPSKTGDTDLFDLRGLPGASGKGALLRMLLDQSVIHPDEWDALSPDARDELLAKTDHEAMLRQLVAIKLLNSYQAERIRSGSARSLVLGNYRVLNRMGSGGSSVVFEAEHRLMRRKVAIKVLPVPSAGLDRTLPTRFLRELRSVARLHHPNIVAAFDAGICAAFHPGEPDLYYFAMEHLTGADLESLVREAPLSITEACRIIYQIASALDEAHRHQLVHRDIKPSNVFVTTSGQAKLLDFGLVRSLVSNAFTSPDVVLGTVEYMAPEQAFDPTRVDARTDLFSLGASLFFALTGVGPFPAEGTVVDAMLRRRTQLPRSARALRPEISPALEGVLQRMLQLQPDDRYPTPQAVMQALLPFVNEARSELAAPASPNGGPAEMHAKSATKGEQPRVLIIDADASVRRRLGKVLAAANMQCTEVADGDAALRELRSQLPEAIIAPVGILAQGQQTLLAHLRENPPCANLKVLQTGADTTDEKIAAVLSEGADDYLPLALSNVQLVARVHSAIKHKAVQDRTDYLSRQLLEMNTELEKSLNVRTTDLLQARNALVLALARLVEYRSVETIAHLTRMQRYCGTLAQEAALLPAFADVIDPDWIQTLECCAPLHDIGNVRLPDHILLKAGRLDDDEIQIMQSHTTIGADTLLSVARRFGSEVPFLHMAIDIVRHHHERYDGAGYPDRLAGENIPLAARITAIADHYDALRSRRAQRPGMTHMVAVQIMMEASPGKYDPLLLGAFHHCAPQFERIFRELPDNIHLD